MKNLKLRDAVYGFCLGDALGVPYEFRKRGSFEAKDMVGYGSHEMPEGTWSDDSSMMLATCLSIKINGKLDLEDIMKKFWLWYDKGYYTPFGECFDVGITTANVLRNYGDRGEILPEKSFYSNGNGSLMRILPLIFLPVTKSDIYKTSALTHGHEISLRACQLYVEIGKKLLKGEDLAQILKNLKLDEVFFRLSSLQALPEEEIKSSGYVVDSLEACLWSILKSKSYEETVLRAVNLGEDTDTIAALAGGLAGIIYGYDSFPESWLNKLKGKDFIESCLF